MSGKSNLRQPSANVPSDRNDTGPEAAQVMSDQAVADEASVANLADDGLPFIPLLVESHFSRVDPNAYRHVHPGMVEIIYCRRGRGVSIDFGDHALPFPAESVMVMQPSVLHTVRPYPKSFSAMSICFRIPRRGEVLSGLSRAETRWLVARLRALPVSFAATDDLARSFQRLWRVYRETPRKAPERRLVVRTAAMQLLMDVLDAAAAGHRPPIDVRLSSLLDEIRENPAREWSVEELATRAAMSVPVLTERCRRLTGLPPHQFIVSCRMEKARKALASTDRSIAAIANDLGIATVSHFAHLFRRETGMSPREWRTARRGKTP